MKPTFVAFLLGCCLATIPVFSQTSQNDNSEKEVVAKSADAAVNMAGVDRLPEFPGGQEKFYEYLSQNLNISEKGISGRMLLQFVIEKDGSIEEVKVIKDVGGTAAEKAIAVLRACPRWRPAEQDGRIVRCSYQLPIVVQ